MTDPASPPFFLAGGALSVDAPSYIDRAADRRLLAGLLRGEFCYVLVSRQMGKSSLMVRTASRLREAGVTTVLLDLNALGHDLDQKQWYYSLIRQIARRLNLQAEVKAYWEQADGLSPLQRWIAVFQDVLLPLHPGPLVIFIDEIDQVRLLPFSTDEFFAGIRSCYSRRPEDAEFRRLTFCLLGVALPADLIKDARLTPFNIGTHIELTDFDREQVLSLKVGLEREAGLEEALLERAYYWTSGHPYLTQSLCRAMVESPNVLTPQDVDALCTRYFLSLDAQEQDDNLAFVRDRILKSEAGSAELLDLYGQVISRKRVAADKANRLVNILLLSGIVRSQNGELVVRNRIYATVFNRAWVRDHMPDEELRRQNAAYRRGVLRTIAVAGSILLAVTALAALSVYNAHRASINEDRAKVSQQNALGATQRADDSAKKALEQTALANRFLYIADMNVIQREWDNNNISHVLKLLDKMKDSKDRGFEWDYWNRLCHMDLITLKGYRGQIYAVAFSPDGRRIVTGSIDHTAKVWDAQTGEERLTLKGHTYEVTSVAFSPDGRRIVTGSTDLTAKVWDAHAEQESRTLKGHSAAVWSVAFSPDGKSIVGGSHDKTAIVWDAQTGQVQRTLKGHTGCVRSVAFSPDGRRIVTGSGDGTVKVWDAQTGEEMLTLKGHTSDVTSVAFSPDGKSIVGGSGDGTARIWLSSGDIRSR